jgi:DNA invertase Pin-like site-specific DNA recombinase
MGWWSAIWEIFKVVAPHAAPHVTEAVKDRWTAKQAAERKKREARDAQNEQEIAEVLVMLEQRMSSVDARAVATEQKVLALEEKLSQAQAQAARNWSTARIWAMWLLAWNAIVTAVLLYLILRRK